MGSSAARVQPANQGQKGVENVVTDHITLTALQSMMSSLRSHYSWLRRDPGMPTLQITWLHESYQQIGKHKIRNSSLQKFTPIIRKNPSCTNTVLTR